MFCSVHNHTALGSNARFTDSTNRVRELVDKAIEYGFNGLAITDHEALCAHVEALQTLDTVHESHPDFKIILGNEIYLIRADQYQNAEKYWHFILLAKDAVGYRQIRELSSRAWERSYVEKGQRRCPTFYEDFLEIVGNNKGHLIASTACVGGFLGTKILENNAGAIMPFLQWCVDTFGIDNFFLEMQDSDSEDQQRVNAGIVKIAERTSLKYIVTQDAHYLNKEDYPIFERFLNGRESKEREVFSFYQYTYVKPESEIRQILSYLPEGVVLTAIENTQLIYQQITPFDFRQSTIVPECRIPAGSVVKNLLAPWYNVCPNIKFFATESTFPQDKYLMFLIEQGIEAKHFNLTDEVVKRIETELDVLRFISDRLGQRLSAYLNLVKTMVDIMWKVSFVGVSRGSAMCFLINYLIGITQANPLDYDIPYWRFLNKERAELPDVDVDSDPNQTDKIIDLFKQYFGDKRVLNCLTYKRESLKSAILTCARGLGMLPEEAQAISALVPAKRGQTYTLAECLNGDPEKDYEPVPQLIEALKRHPGLYEAVEKIEGLPNGIGVHASALYIFNEDYVNQLSMMRSASGTPVTCFDYHAADECGCLKVDELRTDAMTKMMKCMELLLKQGAVQWQGSLRATYDKYLHPDVLDYNNPQMWEDMASGKIANLFQFDSPQGSICIKRTRPTNVKELAAANAVMRLMPQPGEEAPIDRYVRLKGDIEQWYQEMREAGLNEDEIAILEKYLLPKYGNAPEQEDVMLIVMDPAISGFTLKESNNLRKGIAKKKWNIIEEMKEKFFAAGEEVMPE